MMHQSAAVQQRLDGFFWKPLRLIFVHAIGLTPSGGSILSSPAKKEYGKKDAAQGGGDPALRTRPLGWVSVAWVACTGYQTSLLLPAGVGSRCVLNFFQASLQSPSGGHILSSSAKKEYGKKDAA